jgi:hypothetical protein
LLTEEDRDIYSTSCRIISHIYKEAIIGGLGTAVSFFYFGGGGKCRICGVVFIVIEQLIFGYLWYTVSRI